MSQAYQLHENLQADTIALGASALCDVLLMNDATWPWVILVPRRPCIREAYELTDIDQLQLMRESSTLSRGLMEHFAGDKLNVAALGNMVPQLHVHHIVRFQRDSAWPAPIWGKQPAVPYASEALAKRVDELRAIVQAVQAV